MYRLPSASSTQLPRAFFTTKDNRAPWQRNKNRLVGLDVLKQRSRCSGFMIVLPILDTFLVVSACIEMGTEEPPAPHRADLFPAGRECTLRLLLFHRFGHLVVDFVAEHFLHLGHTTSRTLFAQASSSASESMMIFQPFSYSSTSR